MHTLTRSCIQLCVVVDYRWAGRRDQASRTPLTFSADPWTCWLWVIFFSPSNIAILIGYNKLKASFHFLFSFQVLQLAFVYWYCVNYLVGRPLYYSNGHIQHLNNARSKLTWPDITSDCLCICAPHNFTADCS